MPDTVHPRSLRPDRADGNTALAAYGKFNAAANAAAEVVVADPGDYHQLVIDGVVWSYSGAPTGGKLQIKGATTVLVEVDITAAGPGQLLLPGFCPGQSTALTASLAAGGGGVYGKVTVLNPRIEKVG